jgi:plastocyanin
MNKYIIIIIFAIVVLGAGIGYRAFLLPEELKPTVTGVERDITIVARKDKWLFEPEFIEVDKGDKVILTMINEDDYDHGIAIDAYGIAQRMPASATVRTEFIITQEGDFPFYCSVPCGEGIVDGTKRTHFDMLGVIHARSIVSETSGLKPSLTTEELKQQARESSMIRDASNALGIGEGDARIDAQNKEWIESGRTLETLEGRDYQALYYTSYSTQERSWVFIDNSSGEIIDKIVK